MSFLQVQKNINKGNLAAIYLLYGTESFLIEETIDNIINKVLTKDEIDFNLSVFDLKDSPISAAIEEAVTIPFMGKNRVVIVKDPQFLTAKDQTKIEHDLKNLESYLINPVPETIFIIVAPYEKLDERKKIVKLLKKEAEIFEALPFKGSEMDKWIDARVKQFEVEITQSGKEKIIQLSGYRLAMIAGELEKLALYAGKGGVIDETIVQQLVAKTIEQDIFAFVDHIVQRRKKEALQLFYDLLKQKEEPIKILALLARQFRIIYQVKQLSKQGYSQQKIVSTLKLHPYVVKLANQQGNLFTEKQLLVCIDELAEADFNIKTGKVEKQLSLELFIIKVLSGV